MAAILDSNMASILGSNISNTQDLQIIIGSVYYALKHMFSRYNYVPNCPNSQDMLNKA